MKRCKNLAALVAALCLALTLTACSPKEFAADMVIKLATALGFIEEGDDAEETNDVYATKGGDVTFPEDMDTTAARLVTQVVDDTLYVSFSGIANRNTSYFVAGGDSVTVTGYATTESPGLHEYKAALWELGDDENSTSYLLGSTVYYTTGGDCYTQTITGLTPGKKYKVNISYDSGTYYITGGLKITGVGSEELTDVTAES